MNTKRMYMESISGNISNITGENFSKNNGEESNYPGYKIGRAHV